MGFLYFMDTTITDLPTASGIDAAADWFAIDRTSLNTTQKINRNTILGISGSPVGTTDSQTLTNKVITSPTLTVLDNAFTVQDNSDPTKQLQLQLSGISAATTRTLTIPNANTTIVGTDATQTLTNKTLTSPVINNGSITGTTITTDAIVGQTAATNGTVYGMSITGGAIAAAGLQSNAVTTAKIADSAVTPAKLLTGTGSTWVWQSWTPTLANLSGGTINYAKYIQIGKTVFVKFKYTLAGAGMGTGPTITLPVTAAADSASAETGETWAGTVSLIDALTNYYSGVVMQRSTTVAGFRYQTGTTVLTISSTAPFTWGNTDFIEASFFYEAA